MSASESKDEEHSDADGGNTRATQAGGEAEASSSNLPPLVSRHSIYSKEYLKKYHDDRKSSNFYLWRKRARDEMKRNKQGAWKPDDRKGTVARKSNRTPDHRYTFWHFSTVS